MKLKLLFAITLMVITASVIAQPNWQKISTVEEVCTAYPEQINFIFQSLDLSRPGLEEVSKAYASNDLLLACKNLLTYYSKSKLVTTAFPQATQKTTPAADSILQDIYTFQRISGKVPRLPDGHLKWPYAGPHNDVEWAWALNRHYPVTDLIKAYTETGNPKYVAYIDTFVKDWIIKSWPYPGVRNNTAMWRGLEVYCREKCWSNVFFGLMNTKLISPATQLLILSSLPNHAHYARNFHGGGNWLTMEIAGLATVATSWPEYKASPSWLEYAIKTMEASMKDQVYPDGVQTELTSSYHQVALENFNMLAEICNSANVQLPTFYTKTLENMWNYQAMNMRPDGYGPLNNDADLRNNREKILKEADNYNRNDWKYIATNGKSGIKPATGPSFIFPWAGQLISRSDYGQDAQWSFFDIGPYGSGHQHNDKLHLSVFAYGRDFLVDGGRFAYGGEVASKFRGYAVGSQSHNTILVDGKGQAAGPNLVKEPLSENLYKITTDFDYASGSFDKYIKLEGQFSHTRAYFYVRGKFWVIADRVTTDRPRKIEVLWHWHPECIVEQEKNGIVTTKNKRGNLEIIPVGSTGWDVSMVKGQEKPAIQGWYSKEYNIFEPNTASIYTSQINANSTFVWVLYPSKGAAPAIKTEILSQDAISIKVRVTEPSKKHWDITIPFTESQGAKMKSY